MLAGNVVGPSGGSVYDDRVAAGLSAQGWDVRRTDLAGSWPVGDLDARAQLAATLAAVPDGGLVLTDGLVACGVPDVIEKAAERLRIVVLVHLPLPDETGLSAAAAAELAVLERRTLRAVAAVVVTSPWAAGRLAAYDLPAGRIRIAPPGTDPAPLARGSASAGTPELLCVASVTPRKDQLTLVEALALISDLPWRCTCAGPLDRAPEYVLRVQDRIARHGLDQRLRLVGPLEGEGLATAYDSADLVLLVSRTETFGMVITEALSRGIPVVTTAGGATGQTLGRSPDGAMPGLLVSPGDPRALAAAVRDWLTDEALRARLQASARARRGTLETWPATTATLSAVLDGLVAVRAR